MFIALASATVSILAHRCKCVILISIVMWWANFIDSNEWQEILREDLQDVRSHCRWLISPSLHLSIIIVSSSSSDSLSIQVEGDIYADSASDVVDLPRVQTTCVWWQTTVGRSVTLWSDDVIITAAAADRRRIYWTLSNLLVTVTRAHASLYVIHEWRPCTYKRIKDGILTTVLCRVKKGYVAKKIIIIIIEFKLIQLGLPTVTVK